MAKQMSSLKPPFTYEDFKGKDGDYDFLTQIDAEEKWIEGLKVDLPKTNKGDLVGEILSWGRGDGYARYIVVRQSPLTLAHLHAGDAWTVEDALIRGLRIKDVREMIRARKALEEALSRNKATG